METVRLLRMPDCKMASSGVGFWGQPNFTAFSEWFSKQNVYPSVFSYDFASDCGGTGLRWLYIYDERMDLPEGFEIIDFKGGDYAVVTAIDDDEESYAAAMAARDEYLKAHGLAFDDTRWQMGHVLSGYSLAKEILGKGQMDYWLPIKKVG